MRRKDFVPKIGGLFPKPRDRAMSKRKLTSIFTDRNHKLCNLVEQMYQNYEHHVSVKELWIWFMFGAEKYKIIDFFESAPKSRSVGISHFFIHIWIAIWLSSHWYQVFGRDICPFLEKSTWNQPSLYCMPSTEHSTVSEQNVCVPWYYMRGTDLENFKLNRFA